MNDLLWLCNIYSQLFSAIVVSHLCQCLVHFQIWSNHVSSCMSYYVNIVEPKLANELRSHGPIFLVKLCLCAIYMTRHVIVTYVFNLSVLFLYHWWKCPLRFQMSKKFISMHIIYVHSYSCRSWSLSMSSGTVDLFLMIRGFKDAISVFIG